jgi:hypothetical protein
VAFGTDCVFEFSCERDLHVFPSSTVKIINFDPRDIWSFVVALSQDLRGHCHVQMWHTSNAESMKEYVQFSTQAVLISPL